MRALAISADGKTAVSGSFDSSAIRWSLTRNAAEQVLRFHESAVNAVALAPDGRIVTGGEDGKIAVWQPGSPTPRHGAAKATSRRSSALAVSPDGATLASASWDRTIRLWPLARRRAARAGRPSAERQRRGVHAGRQGAGQRGLRPDAAHLAARRRRADRRDAADAAQFGRGRAATARSSPAAPTAACFSSRRPASSAARSTAARRRSSPSPYRATARSSPRPASAARSRSSTAASARSLRTLVGPGLPVWSAAFLPDNRTLLTGGTDRMIRRWDAVTGDHIGQVAMAGADDPLAAYGGDRGARGVPRLRRLPHAHARRRQPRRPDACTACSAAGSRRCRATISRRR